jgi:ATP-binding cassette subfamily B protein
VSPAMPRSTLRRGLAVLGASIRLEPRSFALAATGAAVYAAMTVGSAVVLGRVTDQLIVPSFAAGEARAGAVLAGAATVFAVIALKAVGVATRRIAATWMQFKLEARHRVAIAQRYQRLPLSWHRRHSTGELLSTVQADVEAAFGAIAPLPMSAGVILMLVIAAVVMVLTDPILSLTGLGLGAGMTWLNWYYNRRVSSHATQAQVLRGEVSRVAHESFDGALVVKTLGREAAETERFAERSERLRDELIQVARLRAQFNPVMEALPEIAILLVLLLGGWRAAQGVGSAGTVVQFAYLFSLLAFPLRVLGYLLGDLPRSVAGWDRLRRVLDADESLLEVSGTVAAPAPPAPSELELHGVHFAYDTAAPGDPGLARDDARLVLRDIAFAVPAGRVVALVGPTGSGKSTIASLLVRLADPLSGEVRLDGRNVRDLTRETLSRDAALVFQHSFLFDDTVRDNVTLGEPYSDDEVHAALELAQARAFVARLPNGLDTVVGERGATLSGGQRQRIALARAVVRKPRLLILDDATSSVDSTVEARILRGLRDAALPSTIVLVAYRRATIALADEIVFIDDGLVRARGSHDELMRDLPLYAALITAYDRPEDAA